LRSVEDDHREAEERRKAEERHREWELGMERARERFAQSYRTEDLKPFLGGLSPYGPSRW
jgi:hypothetical protein